MKDALTAVIYDMDSTVCDTRHRWPLNPRADPSSDWEKYSLACADDLPIAGTLARMRLDWPHHQVHICTGRSSVARELTLEWLDEQGADYDYLKMRKAGNYVSNGLFKVQYITQLRENGVLVVLAYEDWSESATFIQEKTGVPVLGINPFYPEDIADLEAGRQARGAKGGL